MPLSLRCINAWCVIDNVAYTGKSLQGDLVSSNNGEALGNIYNRGR